MKKICTLILFCIFLINGACFSQDMFQKYISNYFTMYPVAGLGGFQTYDHGYIITATENFSGSSYMDASIVKTDSAGQPLWGKVYEVPYLTGIRMIRETPDSGFIFTGVSNSFGTNWVQVYLMRIDKFGDTLWTKFYNDNNNYVSNDMCLTGDSGFAVVGNGTASHLFVLKTDQFGNTLFLFEYYISGYTITGKSIKATDDGGLIVAGEISSSILGDAILLKLNSAGQVEWCRRYGGIGYEETTYIQQTFDKGFIIAGDTRSFGAGLSDIFLLKTDSVGDVDWVKSYGGVKADYPYYVQQTSDSGYVVAGGTLSFPLNIENSYMLKTDSIGNLEFSKTLGSRLYTVDQTNDGNYVLVGVGGSLPQIYLVKTDSVGNTGCTNSTPATIETVGSFADSNLTVLKYPGGVENRYSFNVFPANLIVGECLINSNDEMSQRNSISFSPNPISNNSFITFSEELKNAEVVISDMLGKVCIKKLFNGKELEIESAYLRSGIYLMNVKSDRGLFQSKLIIL